MITVLLLYRPVAWCFLRGVKKHKTLIISIVAAVVIVVTPFIPWGKFWGTEVEYYKDGSKYRETPYRFFREHGTEFEYRWNDGTKERETPFVNGIKHGTAIAYYGNGSKEYEIPYVKGKKHGTSIWYYPNGTKEKEILYENGKEISEKKF